MTGQVLAIFVLLGMAIAVFVRGNVDGKQWGNARSSGIEAGLVYICFKLFGL
ncbi:hypothetical protein M5W70_20600 [Paenibacillus larvae]|uniref:hypothetical protein n=1 Tax=Paenibacillus larvae TaxID=1464 RepID=UPI00024816C2|nr:hypothetical protein [Paenibacillus larvae]MCY9691000.1 hypothetical protein [Paenibacillus larvae]